MRSLFVFLCLATSAVAQTAAPAVCSGTNPDWTLDIRPDGATLDFVRVSELTLALSTTPADGSDWPQAYTFIGRGDSAIVIREAPQNDGGGDARVLTQRGETPLLLVGTCTSR